MIRIADILVDWKNDDEFTRKFLSDDTEQPSMCMTFPRKMQECHSVQYTDICNKHFFRGKNGDVLLANDDWTEAESYYLPDFDRDFALPLAAICSRFSYYNAMLIHSSFVKYKGKGIVFTGYSGVGKTTQAKLWQRYLGADIVNGDKAFLREIENEFYAYGLPWKGSSDYCLNEKAPLSAIVILQQSDNNRIIRLDEKAAEYFLPHIFLPHWDKECLGKTLDTFDRLLKEIPFYLLECRPDEEAVKLTRDTVLG